MTPLHGVVFVIVGLGGLGCPALLGLVAAGARRFMLVDDDHVDASNLARQVLYGIADVGKLKVERARAFVCARAHELDIVTHAHRIDVSQVSSFLTELPDRAILLDCTDDPRLKFAINDACVRSGRSVVIGGVLQFRGQAMAVAPDSACFRCIYEAPPPAELAPACGHVGVLGTVAGVLGYVMASLAVRIALHERDTSGNLLDLDLRTGATRTLHAKKRENCRACANAA